MEERFENASVTVDVALLTIRDDALQVLVHRRPTGVEAGAWALPGVFIQPTETPAEAALRAIRDKAALPHVYLEQLYTFGRVDRDPRGRIITIAHYALVPHPVLAAALTSIGDDQLRLVPAATPPALAFDHAEIIATAVTRLRGKVNYAPVGYQLLADTFTLRDLRRVHEAILDRSLNKDSFRRRILESGEITPTGRHEEGAANRPAELFRRIER